ncbi:hypothetical protein [Phytohabitans kaempferiae]|uniref:ESX-1 secretion-associated protein EspA/EspE-like domain-containing protein n=1 Tax=Phytohabitans kaempferiae TaxID=1620943 RepID=A0ABV6M5T7_9ACTN
MGEENPYQSATNFNTRTDWLSDQKPVDLNLDGMGDFAQNMQTIHDNLRDELGYVHDLHSVPMKAWEGIVLGEASFVRTRMGDNAKELSHYLQRLSSALLNIGMAAQTIADTYGAADGFSAIELNTVRYAFAEPGAARPSGLSPLVTGETYEEKMAAIRPTAGAPPVTRREPRGGETPRRTVTTETHADGSQTVTTRNAEGEVTEQVRTAPQTAGGPGVNDSPRQRALDSVEGMY